MKKAIFLIFALILGTDLLVKAESKRFSQHKINRIIKLTRKSKRNDDGLKASVAQNHPNGSPRLVKVSEVNIGIPPMSANPASTLYEPSDPSKVHSSEPKSSVRNHKESTQKPDFSSVQNSFQKKKSPSVTMPKLDLNEKNHKYNDLEKQRYSTTSDTNKAAHLTPSDRDKENIKKTN